MLASAEAPSAQSDETKRLAAWAAIIAVPTMVAGIYGMNFRFMPEVEWSLGYPFALALMVASVAAPFIYFQRKGWLR